jgi:hypothetical protein
MITLRRMKWTVHITGMGAITNAYKILVRKPEGKRPLGRPRHRGRVILRLILKKYSENVWTGFMWVRVGTSGELL